MKKKLKIIVCLVLITICSVAIIQIKPTVDALGEDTPSVVEKPKRSCSSGINKELAHSKYNPDVRASYHSNGATYDIKVSAGTFDVYVYEIEYDESTGETWTVLRDKFDISSGKTKTYTLQRGDRPINYDLVFNLIKSNQFCDVDEIPAEPKRKANGEWTTSSESGLGYVFAYQVEVPASISDPYFRNIHYDGICAALRNNNYDAYSKQFNAVGLTKELFEQYRSRVLEGFNYCNNYYVTVSYKESEIARIIRNIIAGIKIEETDINGTLKGPDSSDSEIVSETASMNFSMQCPAYNGSNMPNQASTVKKYYKQEITETKYDVYTTIPGEDATCTKTCEENVTVTYGPPVASKAGLCFEYKVKVQSELNCVTEFDGAMPKPEDYTVCTPIGACNGLVYHSASGPSEDFDSCVASCDGGKYTQECIDTCYEEVYTEENTIEVLPVNYYNKLISANNSKVVKLTSEEERYNDILDAKDNIGNGKKYSIDDLKTAIVEASTGYYDVSANKKIVWIAGSRYWEKPGRYYTLNITGFTVGRLKTASDSYWNTVWYQGGLSIVDYNGFLRNNAGGTSYCTADCAWYGCEKAKNNEYYQGKDASNREFLNSEDAVKVYLDEFTRYEAAAKECKASAACTSQVSEFTIKVNNKTNTNPDVDNWIDYATSITESGNLTATTMNGKNLADDTTIILDKSGCYSYEKPRGNATYMTEWSFPGTWVNNKTGKISYEAKSGNAWHLKKEKFCTNLDSKYVNTAWWTQRILQPNTPVADSDKATIEEYNIQATTKDFGYFKWNFNIGCFYALYDNPIPNTPSETDDENAVLSYTTRTVSLSDIFPNNESEDITTNPNETGRTPGYNWTDSASNLKNLDYEVTPEALYSTIQARGNEIYDANKQDTYLDYEFYLSPSDLNTIRKYSKEEADGNYNKYPGKVNVANGVAYYESALFRSSSTNSHKLKSSSIITLGALGVNNQKRKGSNEAETFENTYTAILKQSREEYLNYLSGGKK